MRKIALLFIMIAMAASSSAQVDNRLRVAVFDPSSSGTSIDDGTKIAVREIISSTIVNTGKYNIVERSLLEKVMKEQEFSNSGIVDDRQATEVGKLAGANKVVLSVVTLTGGRNMLSVKVIDVKTATVERQKVKVVTSGELLDIVQGLTLELLDEKALQSSQASTSSGKTSQAQITAHSMPSAGEIVFYLPAGYDPKKEKSEDNIITVFLDNRSIGSGSLTDGFHIKIKDPKPGPHKLKFGSKRLGEATSYNINTKITNYFEFKIRHWKYLGVDMYSVVHKTTPEQTTTETNQIQEATGIKNSITETVSSSVMNQAEQGKVEPINSSDKLAPAVSNLITLRISEQEKAKKVATYKTDIDKFVALKGEAVMEIDKFIVTSATITGLIPPSEANNVIFFLETTPTTSPREQSLMLFIDGLCIGVGATYKGLYANISNTSFSPGFHTIILTTTGGRVVFTSAVDFSLRNKFIFKRNHAGKIELAN